MPVWWHSHLTGKPKRPAARIGFKRAKPERRQREEDGAGRRSPTWTTLDSATQKKTRSLRGRTRVERGPGNVRGGQRSW